MRGLPKILTSEQNSQRVINSETNLLLFSSILKTLLIVLLAWMKGGLFKSERRNASFEHNSQLFCDAEGILLFDYHEHWPTITGQCYITLDICSIKTKV